VPLWIFVCAFVSLFAIIETDRTPDYISVTVEYVVGLCFIRYLKNAPVRTRKTQRLFGSTLTVPAEHRGHPAHYWMMCWPFILGEYSHSHYLHEFSRAIVNNKTINVLTLRPEPLSVDIAPILKTFSPTTSHRWVQWPGKSFVCNGYRCVSFPSSLSSARSGWEASPGQSPGPGPGPGPGPRAPSVSRSLTSAGWWWAAAPKPGTGSHERLKTRDERVRLSLWTSVTLVTGFTHMVTNGVPGLETTFPWHEISV